MNRDLVGMALSGITGLLLIAFSGGPLWAQIIGGWVLASVYLGLPRK